MKIGLKNTTRELARYETALDLLNMMVAVASADIASEEGSGHPDARKIATLVQDKVTYRRAALALAGC